MLQSRPTTESLSPIASVELNPPTTSDTRDFTQWIPEFVQELEQMGPIPVRVRELLLETPIEGVTLKEVKKNKTPKTEIEKVGFFDRVSLPTLFIIVGQEIQSLRQRIAAAKNDV